MISPAAGILAWLGLSLVVVADGRRGLAAGIALTAAAFTAFALLTAGPVAGAMVAAGGAIAAARRYTTGEPGWAIMPAGSTPRLLLCIAAALVAFWVAAGVTSGSYASLRFGVIVGSALSAARVLSAEDQSVLLSAVAVLALTIGAATAVGSPGASVWAYVAGGLVAAAAGWLPLRQTRAA